MNRKGKTQSGESNLRGASEAVKTGRPGPTGRPEPALEPLQIGSAVYDTRITGKFRNRKPWVRPDPRQVRAFIPGNIQKIFVKEGMEVEQGTPLLILEAMKMRNEFLSPVSGKIKCVLVSEGDQVPKNHLLIEFAG